MRASGGNSAVKAELQGKSGSSGVSGEMALLLNGVLRVVVVLGLSTLLFLAGPADDLELLRRLLTPDIDGRDLRLGVFERDCQANEFNMGLCCGCMAICVCVDWAKGGGEYDVGEKAAVEHADGE